MKIAIIGTGNVAYHLAKRLNEAGNPPLTIIGRSKQKALALAQSLNLNTDVTIDFDHRKQELNFVLIAVPDKEITNVIADHRFREETILLHASGAQKMDLLKSVSNHYGVLYPFQTFTKEKPVDFDEIPLLIEGNSVEVEGKIEKLARLFGPKVHKMDSSQRLKVHLAAVFACNFTNNLFTIAESVLKGSGLGLHDLEHLITETVEKAMSLSPREAQTGPAIRRDTEVIQDHLANLEDEDLRQLYELHTRLIQRN